MLVFIDGRKAKIGVELLHKCRVYNKRVEAIKEVRECFRCHEPMHNYVYNDTISLRSAKDFCDNILNMKQDDFDQLMADLGEKPESIGINSREAREIVAQIEKLEVQVGVLKDYLETIIINLERKA